MHNEFGAANSPSPCLDFGFEHYHVITIILIYNPDLYGGGNDLRFADVFSNKLTADCVLVLGASLARVDQAPRQQGPTQRPKPRW